MIKKIKFYIALLLCLIACLCIGPAFAKYKTEFNINSFTLNVDASNEIFAVFGAVEKDGISQGNALNFYNRSKPELGDTITLDDGSVQTVTEIYTGFDTAEYKAGLGYDNGGNTNTAPWFNKEVKTASVVDSGIAPSSTEGWFYFSNGSVLTSVNVEKLDTRYVKSMRAMFRNCFQITELKLNNFNTEKVTDMSGMFYSCRDLNSLDVTSFNTTNVTDMDSMFRNCQNITRFNLYNFDTSNVENMQYMFTSCQALKILDLSSFNTSNVTNMYRMFNSPNLTTVYVSEMWNTDKVNSYSGIFASKFLVGGAGSSAEFYNEYNDKLYARIDGGTSAPGYFTYYKYSVVFEANGGTNVPDILLSVNNECTIPTEALEHPWGTPLIGWTTTEGSETVEYYPGDTFVFDAEAPACDVLYAVWADYSVLSSQNDIFDVAYDAGIRKFEITGGDWAEDIGRMDNTINVHIIDGTFSMTWFYDRVLNVTIDGGTFLADSKLKITGIDSTTVVINNGRFEAGSIDFAGTSGDIKIFGGTFEEAPSDAHDNYGSKIAEGYVAVDNGDGTWTVSPDPNASQNP